MLQIVTDSASDITLEQARQMGIRIVPLRIEFSDGECPQEKDEDFEIFYNRLIKAQKLPVTSQPSPQQYLTIFEEAKEAGDEVLVLTLSSGLSGTIGSAQTARELCGYDPIYIVDSRQAILAQRMLVEYAVKLRDSGMDTRELIDKVKEKRDHITVCGMLDTLTYLRKGGRIPASLAIIGNALSIKPVIILEDTILKTLGKVRGRKAGKKYLHKRFEQAELDPEFPVYFGYSSNKEISEEFMRETVEKYGLKNAYLYPVGGIIGTHVGTDCIAITFASK